MLTLLFTIALFVVFGNLFTFAIKAAWSIFKIVGVIFFLPVILLGMCIMGLFYLALPVLIIVGLVSLCVNITSV